MFNDFARYEDDFAQWRADGYPGVTDETWRYIDFLSDADDDSSPRAGTLWPHQWEAFLRVIYSYEVLGKDQIGANGLLLNVVTGGGKTAVAAALVAWLRIAHDVQKFALLCPNLIVRDRLDDDFEKGKVFEERDLLPVWGHARPSDFTLTTLGSGKDTGWSSFLGASIVLGNIHQFYTSNKVGQSNLSALMNGPDFVLFNDEAHNSPALEYEATLRKVQEKTILRVDMTATPERADGKTPESSMVYEYSVADALADRLIKTTVVYRPNISTVELTYTDARTGENRRVEEIDWEEVDRLGLSATQWVTDDEPMRQQMAIALKRLTEQETRAKRRYQPILFVVAVCKADAEKAASTLRDTFGVKTLLVTEDSEESDRLQARELGRRTRTRDPYKAVVSVLMLREGWDVPEVGVILLLRKFSSQVYGQQVIGRGLRRVRHSSIADDEPQILAITDHPKLEHDWLWTIFGAKKRSNVAVDDEFDEQEDLPPPPRRQEILRPEQIIDLPEEIKGLVDEGEFEIEIDFPAADPLKDWREAIQGFSYDENAIEITRVEIEAVLGTELGDAGWQTLTTAPEAPDGATESFEISDELMRDAIKTTMLEFSEELTVQAGYATSLKGKLYGVMTTHVRENFLGASLGLAERDGLMFALKMLPQVYRNLLSVPGLVAGIIEYGD